MEEEGVAAECVAATVGMALKVAERVLVVMMVDNCGEDGEDDGGWNGTGSCFASSGWDDGG